MSTVINRCFALTAMVVCCASVAEAEGPGEPSLADVLNRLEQTERELAETRSQLDTLQQRDVQRQRWEKEIIHRLPETNENEVFIPASSEWSVHSNQPMPPSDRASFSLGNLKKTGENTQSDAAKAIVIGMVTIHASIGDSIDT